MYVSHTAVEVLLLKDMKWRYICEGNQHIILEVVKTNKVLRLFKENGSTVQLEYLAKCVAFVEDIMIPLIQNNVCTYEYKVLEIPKDDIMKLVVNLQSERPKARLKKSCLSTYAVSTLNLTKLGENSVNICVEIKPKHGFLSESLKQHGICYFCMKQYLKLKSRQIDKIGSYCPLDLFSGVKDRMQTAFLNLLDNPQNNLRIFKNGNMVNASLDCVLNDVAAFEKSKITFINFLVECLLTNKDSISIQKDDKNPICVTKSRSGCIENSSTLPKGSVLDRILRLQKLGENYDIGDGIKPEGDYIGSLLEVVKAQKLDLSNDIDKEKLFHMCDSMTLALIAAIAKDCSIMICFSELCSEHTASKAYINGHVIWYRTAVTDLEPKPITTLSKRQATMRKILDAYRSYTL